MDFNPWGDGDLYADEDTIIGARYRTQIAAAGLAAQGHPCARYCFLLMALQSRSA